MALFKILKGENALPTTKTEGWAYVRKTGDDSADFYVDYDNSTRVKINKYADSANSADEAVRLATTVKISAGTAVTATAQNFNGTAGITIPITSVKEAYLAWGGKSIAADISPVDAAASALHSANRFAFGKAAGITIEYSTNGGSTWTDYGATDAQKISLVSGLQQNFVIGKKSSGTVTTSDQLRVTLNATSMGVYTALKKLLIEISTSGATGSKIKIEKANKGSESTFSTIGTYDIGGWSGWNSIPVICAFGGGATQTGNVAVLRLTFSITGLGSNSSYSNRLGLMSIVAIGTMYWSTPSNMAKIGSVYSYDTAQNVTFPAKVTATNFIGSLTGNASTATTATNLATNPTVAWTNGTAAGPQLTISAGNKNSTAVAIPSASANASGVITTGAQTFAGAKTFNGGVYVNNSISTPWVIRRNASDGESVSHSVDDANYTITYTNDEKTNNIVFKLINKDTENSDGSGANTSTVTFAGSSSGSVVTATKFVGNLTGTATTATNLASAPTVAWTAGTTAGPQLTVSAGGKNSTAVAIPTASTSASGIVIKGSQTFGGNKFTNGTHIGMVSGGENDQFLDFAYAADPTASTAPGASWRIGALNSGSGNTNYFVIQTGGSNTSATTWKNAIRIGMNNLDITIAGQLVPTTTNTIALGTSSLKWSEVYATNFYGNFIGNATTASQWENTRTITLTGGATGSFQLNGSKNVSFATTVTVASVTGLTDALALKAPLASPALTGTPTAPTATAGTNSTQIATTAFVKNAVDTAVFSKMTFMGTITSGTLPSLPSNGDMWKVGKAIAKTSLMDRAAAIGDTIIYSSGTGLWSVIPSGDDIEDTWRTIQVNGTSLLGGGTSTGVVNFKAGTNVTLTGSDNTITIAAKDTTYSAATTSTAGLMSAADKTKLESFSAVTSITKTLTVTTDWVDTGIVGDSAGLSSGTYIVSVYNTGNSVTGLYQETFSGIMSWFNGTTNSTDSCEILLHSAGHAPNGKALYLRTVRQASSGYLKLQISASASLSSSSYVFKFRRVL